jgi:membrane fusion protein, multidrug efflux system
MCPFSDPNLFLQGRKPMSISIRSDSRLLLRRTHGLWALAGLLVLVVATGCGEAAQVDDARASGEPGSTRVINVEVLTLESGPFTEIVRITGSVLANRDVTVSAEESGVIRELLAARGAVVSEGQPLARIDSRVLEAQVREAEARAGFASETWERRRRLFEVDGVGSELAYLEARANAEQAQASLETLRERLDRAVVRAPISGVLDRRDVEVGTMVSPGTPIARIVQINPVKVEGGVPERFAADVGVGAPVRVTFDVLPDEVFEARVSFAGSAVNPRNRTYPIEVVVPNAARVIKPEMVANLEITRRELESVVVIPQDAVIRVEEGYIAFVVVERDGREFAEARPVVAVATQRNLIAVREGLAAGDRLVVVGQQQVAAGDRVQVVRVREAAND